MATRIKIPGLRAWGKTRLTGGRLSYAFGLGTNHAYVIYPTPDHPKHGPIRGYHLRMVAPDGRYGRHATHQTFPTKGEAVRFARRHVKTREYDPIDRGGATEGRTNPLTPNETGLIREQAGQDERYRDEETLEPYTEGFYSGSAVRARQIANKYGPRSLREGLPRQNPLTGREVGEIRWQAGRIDERAPDAEEPQWNRGLAEGMRDVTDHYGPRHMAGGRQGGATERYGRRNPPRNRVVIPGLRSWAKERLKYGRSAYTLRLPAFAGNLGILPEPWDPHKGPVKSYSLWWIRSPEDRTQMTRGHKTRGEAVRDARRWVRENPQGPPRGRNPLTRDEARGIHEGAHASYEEADRHPSPSGGREDDVWRGGYHVGRGSRAHEIARSYGPRGNPSGFRGSLRGEPIVQHREGFDPAARARTRSVRWNVYHGGRLIEVVFFQPGMTAPEIKQSLVSHDGYPADIAVALGRQVFSHPPGRPDLVEDKFGTLRSRNPLTPREAATLRQEAETLAEDALTRRAAGDYDRAEWLTGRGSGLEDTANTYERRNPGAKGAYPFTEKEAYYAGLTDAQLHYALLDARKAIQTFRGGHDPAAEAWYYDDASTIHNEINRRRGRRNPGTPDPMSNERFAYRLGFREGDKVHGTAWRGEPGHQHAVNSLVQSGFREAEVTPAMIESWLRGERHASRRRNPLTAHEQRQIHEVADDADDLSAKRFSVAVAHPAGMQRDGAMVDAGFYSGKSLRGREIADMYGRTRRNPGRKAPHPTFQLRFPQRAFPSGTAARKSALASLRRIYGPMLSKCPKITKARWKGTATQGQWVFTGRKR